MPFMSKISLMAMRRMVMIAMTAVAFLTVLAPSTVARSGPGNSVGPGTSASMRRSKWHPPSSHSTWVFRPRKHGTAAGGPIDSSHCLVHGGRRATDRSNEAMRVKHCLGNDNTFASLRGGGETESIFTLCVRVFLPKFRRERLASEEEVDFLDLDSGGLRWRLRRLLSRVISLVPAFSGGSKHAKKTREKTTSAEKILAAGKVNRKGNGNAGSHLEQTYRPGNANYRIQKELKEFMANPPENCRVNVGKNIRVWIVTIKGAEGTIYAGEKFRLRVAFPEDYPTKPPAVYFLQTPPPPKHQHIYTNGDICLSLLSSQDWKPNLTVMSLALSILSMLSSAKEKRFPEDNASHADARPGQAQQWIYHDDLC